MSRRVFENKKNRWKSQAAIAIDEKSRQDS
jgi:hypothetical protein